MENTVLPQQTRGTAQWKVYTEASVSGDHSSPKYFSHAVTKGKSYAMRMLNLKLPFYQLIFFSFSY